MAKSPISIALRNWYWAMRFPAKNLIAISFRGDIDQNSADYLFRKAVKKLEKGRPDLNLPPVGSRVLIKAGEHAGKRAMVSLHGQPSPTERKVCLLLAPRKPAVVNWQDIQLDDQISEANDDLRSALWGLKSKVIDLENMSRYELDNHWIELMRGELEIIRKRLERIEKSLKDDISIHN